MYICIVTCVQLHDRSFICRAIKKIEHFYSKINKNFGSAELNNYKLRNQLYPRIDLIKYM